VGTPAALRAQHPQQERVRLVLGGLAPDRAAQILSAELGPVPSATTDEAGRAVLTFTREPGNDALDRALRALLKEGARVVSCETERASLLDVLEVFESDEQAKGEAR
ncbi:MAG TPA: hypothetical protein VGV38_08835, partial [Pyrinomonadaceae bacterium]|nr:hypothetical protein [Pyrinomonadaceae bacterium]